ncbi:MAG: hypothetical protein KGJ93_03995 [Patescibacteria group bacterium]|nr:hypothetical protein [Patescibacteria group bacterium]
MKPGLPSMVRTYNEHGGQPIRLFVVEEAMYKDGVGKLLNEQFPDVPALKFMFDPQVIHRTGPKWYAGQIRNFVANLGAPKLGAPKCS